MKNSSKREKDQFVINLGFNVKLYPSGFKKPKLDKRQKQQEREEQNVAFKIVADEFEQIQNSDSLMDSF